MHVLGRKKMKLSPSFVKYYYLLYYIIRPIIFYVL